MANPLDDFINARVKKPFSMTDYEAIPVENRQKYVKNTTANMPAVSKEPTMNIEGDLKVKTPVSTPRVEEIKKIFAPAAPEMAPIPPTTPVPETPAKVPPVEEKGFDWASLLPALAPLATEMLMSGGGTAGESLGISGSHLLTQEGKKETRKNELENKLLDMQKARELASIKALGKEKPLTVSNTLPYVAEDGKVRYKLVGEALGEERPTEVPKGLTASDREAAQARAFAHQKQMFERKNTIQAGARVRQSLQNNKPYQAYVTQASNAQKAIEWLAQGKNIADVGVKKVFAKGLFGDVGNIAVQEAADIAGSPSLYSRYLTLKAQMTTPGYQFSDADRADMMKFAQIIKDSVPQKMKLISDQQALAEKGISGVDVQHITNALSKDVNTGKTMVKVVVDGLIYPIDSKDYPDAVRKHRATLYTGNK